MNDINVTINLDTLDSNEVRAEGELIFQKQHSQLLRKIRRKADENKELLKEQAEYGSRRKEQEEELRGIPTCFFIDGSRGSGKSTLMRAVREALVNGKSLQEGEPQISLYPLADVDPTELGKGENFFLYLLGRIYKILEEKFDQKDFRDDEMEIIRSAMEDLRQMSGGLQVLMDSESALKNADSPDFFLENCVEKCADSTLLRKRLSNLLEKLAKIVHRAVFLVTIDDADLNFSKCEDVLEYVRKYLQSPRLIFLFAGDMQLYAHIVRGLYINHFKKEQLCHDTTHEEHRHQLLNQLEEQYLLKLFPVDCRVQTPGLAKALADNCRILIQENAADDTKLTLQNYIQKHFTGKAFPEDEFAFIDTILQLPARSVFFLLRYLSKNPDARDVQKSAKYVWEGIHMVFSQALVQFNLNYELFEHGNIAQLQKAIFQYCSRARLWNSDLSLLTTAADASTGQVALYLSGVVSEATQSLSSKLLYWCACFPAWQGVCEYYLSVMDARKTQEWMGDFLKIGDGRHQTKWANMACGCMAPKNDEHFLFGRGTVCLLNHDAEQNNEKGYETRYGLQTLLQKLKEEGNVSEAENRKFVAGVHASLCRIDDSADSHYFMSVYHLLMLVGDWLEFGSRILKRLAGDSEKEGALAEQIEQGHVKQLIRARLAGMRVVPNAYQISRSDIAEHDVSLHSRVSYVYEGMEDESVVDELYSWLTTYTGVSYVSAPAAFSRAWKAFLAKCTEATAACKVEYEDEKDCPKAGIIFQQYMFAVEYALHCLTSPDEKNLADCVMTFPFWKSLSRPAEVSGKQVEILNAAHIGNFVNTRKRADVLAKKKEYEAAEIKASLIKKQKAENDERLDKESQLLKELQMEVEERKVQRDLCKSKMMDFEEQKSEIQQRITRYLNEEKSIFGLVESLTKEENNLNTEYNLVSQKLQTFEKISIGILDPLKAKDRLRAEISKTKKLLNQAKTEETRQRHEQTLMHLQSEWDAYQQPKSALVANEVIQQARDAKNELNQQYRGIMEQLSDAKARERSLKIQREAEVKALSEMQRREEAFSKMDFDADVSYQLAQMKSAHQKKQVDTLVQGSEELSERMAQAQRLCAEAKLEYEKARKHD